MIPVAIFFEDNQIESLPEGLEKLDRLTTLSLRNNPLISQSESIQVSLKALKDRGCNVFLD
ncbi:MAG: hypothetical protein ACW964_08740 [Candidatus Hodarchaeales archaeon]|jgi:Leucine-rich repeat (LRR) protein